MDYCYEIVDNPTQSRYIVLENDYFTLNTENIKNVKFDYECRNYIMCELSRKCPERYYMKMIDCCFEDDFEFKDGIFYNKRKPYMFFTNNYVPDLNNIAINSIMENYDDINIDNMISIVASKKCHQDFFIINNGKGKYTSCNMHTRHLNYFEEEDKDMIIEELYENPDFVIKKRHLSVSTIKENVNYCMSLDTGDILTTYFDQIAATTEGNDFVVQFVISDDEIFIKHEGKYIDGNEMLLTNDKPEIGFTLLQDNEGYYIIKFKEKYINIEWFKSAYGGIIFKENSWTRFSIVES
ncbi:hypothetical protein K450DRAFT_264143 [Umbelopsis ramanniana AG]|uniref:Uncharacterized protein n=1 Tax=Umbelopsis ramanniana AG TaxID=1314678 RepID=A0AAD5H781_UMBRA|nr:uncharacterized protein K450DRAFT_264143 [Umbelopsis ramanniana AG]KAI8574907.1 hypothetical protein K450DRAFT_264143 [Umbelopsis ramanniana AG]